MIVIHYLASAERRSLSPIYLDFSFRLSPVAQQTFSYIYKNIAIVYIRTEEIHGRFADVFGRFCIIIFSLADRQTAHYYRVIGGFGVSLCISSATEDSCSFLPMRYPRISTRRCVGRLGISSGHSLAVAQQLVHRPGTDVIVCASKPEIFFSSWVNLSQDMDSSFSSFGCMGCSLVEMQAKISTEWWRHGGTLVIDEGTEEPSSSRK